MLPLPNSMSKMEEVLYDAWKDVLQAGTVHPDDNFFELGGNSLLAVRMIDRLEKHTGRRISLLHLFENPTISQLATCLHAQEASCGMKSLVEIKKGTGKIPLYIVCGGDNGTVFRFKTFANMLDAEQPVYGLQQPLTTEEDSNFPGTVEDIAARYIAEIIAHNPDGPYALSGYCLGGVVAFEMAKQMQAAGKKIHLLILYECHAPSKMVRTVSQSDIKQPHQGRRWMMTTLYQKVIFNLYFFRYDTNQALHNKLKTIRFTLNNANMRFRRFSKILAGGKKNPINTELFSPPSTFDTACREYSVSPYHGDLFIFYGKQVEYDFKDFVEVWNERIEKKRYFNESFRQEFFFRDDLGSLGWKPYVRSVTSIAVDGNHLTLFEFETLARSVQGLLHKRPGHNA